MATHCSILVWRFPWTVEPGGLQSIGCPSGCKELDTTEATWRTEDRYGYFLMLVFACVCLSPPNYNPLPPSKGCVLFTSVCPNASTLCAQRHSDNSVTTKTCWLKYLMSCGNGYDSTWWVGKKIQTMYRLWTQAHGLEIYMPKENEMDKSERGRAPKFSSPADKLTGTIHLFPPHMLLPRCPTLMIRR